MTYEKPEVIVVASAASAVQSVKKDGAQGDNGSRTIPAYEADE